MTRAQYRWRMISYFFAAASPAFVGAIVTAGDETTGIDWAVASFMALGAGFAALRGLLDQSESPPKEGDPLHENQ